MIGHRSHEVRVLDRCGAQYHPEHPGVEQVPSISDRPDAPTGLDGHVERGGHRGDYRPVYRVTSPGGVEVHHVDPVGARLLEGQGLGDGILAVHGLPVVVALHEAHAATST